MDILKRKSSGKNRQNISTATAAMNVNKLKFKIEIYLGQSSIRSEIFLSL